jgi:hypothetical protein
VQGDMANSRATSGPFMRSLPCIEGRHLECGHLAARIRGPAVEISACTTSGSWSLTSGDTITVVDENGSALNNYAFKDRVCSGLIVLAGGRSPVQRRARRLGHPERETPRSRQARWTSTPSVADSATRRHRPFAGTTSWTAAAALRRIFTATGRSS